MLRKTINFVKYRFHSHENNTCLTAMMLRNEIRLFGILLYSVDSFAPAGIIPANIDNHFQYAPIVKEFNKR